MNQNLIEFITLAAVCMTSCTAPEPLTGYIDPRIGTFIRAGFFSRPRRCRSAWRSWHRPSTSGRGIMVVKAL